MATPASQRMADVVADIAPALKDAGFRKRRHGFNRAAGDDVIHVVSFQMGAFDPPGTPEIPGLRENLYGRFTINLGVFSAAMHVDPGDPPSGWINEYDCQIRKRIGHLLDEPADTWWKLGTPAEEAAAAEALLGRGVPWLDGLSSHDDILRRAGVMDRFALGFPPRGPLHVAALHASRGDVEAARAVVDDYLEEDLNPHHRPVAEAFARRLIGGR